MILRWNQRVSKSDDVYILGDFACCADQPASWYLRQLRGKKHLICGNHDGGLLKEAEAVSLLASIDKMLFVRDDGEKLVLCHFPLAEWNGFYRGAWHLYGHIHGRWDCGAYTYMKGLERARNTGCMLHDYRPKTFQELRAVDWTAEMVSPCPERVW